MSIVHDEAFTYMNYIKDPFIDTLLYREHFPNNHYLNSVLSSLSVRLLDSNSEFVIRLPNILSFFIYIVASYLTISRLKSISLKLPMFIFLLTNLFVLEQFSLGRGYGLGIAFMGLSISALLFSFSSNRRLLQTISVVMAGLSTLSNMTFILFMISLAIFILAENFRDLLFSTKTAKSERIGKLIDYVDSILPTIIIVISVVAFIAGAIVDQRNANQFYYGGESLIFDTAKSIVKTSYYIFSNNYDLYISIGVIGIILAFFILQIVSLGLEVKRFKGWEKFPSEAYSIPMIFNLILLGSLILHVVGGTPYFLERTAIFLFPLLVISFFLILDHLQARSVLDRKYIYGFTIFISIVHLLFSFYKADLDSTYTWKYDTDSKEALNLVIDGGLDEDEKLCVHWLLSPSSSYYLSLSSLSEKMVLFNDHSTIFMENSDMEALCKYVYSVGEIEGLSSSFSEKYFDKGGTYLYSNEK